jgi:hypothetical protein
LVYFMPLGILFDHLLYQEKTGNPVYQGCQMVSFQTKNPDLG